MVISKDKFVAIHYTLKDEKGVQMDSSAGGEPLGFVFGRGYLISGLEKQLEGKSAGDKFSCTIQPEEAYGHRDERLVAVIPMSQFDSSAGVEVGMQFQVTTPEGPAIVTVVEIDGDKVKIDGNHEMAGKILNFDIEVVEVRDMTEIEEAQLMFSQGCGGCGGCGGDCGSGCNGPENGECCGQGEGCANEEGCGNCCN